MLALGTVVLIAGLQVISAQFPPAIPAECKNPPPVLEKPYDCCTVPPLFSAEDHRECGFNKIPGIDPADRFNPDHCPKQMCIMKKYGLTKDGVALEHMAISQYLDHWVLQHPIYQPALAKLKKDCIGNVPGPAQICEVNRFMFCASTALFWECPSWIQTPGCQTLGKLMAFCKPYLYNNK